MLARILLPLDGSARAERAIRVAAKLAQTTSGTVVLVRVVTPPVVYGPAFVVPPLGVEIEEELREQATTYLTGIAKSPLLAGIPTHIAVRSGQPADAILTVANDTEADSIILTSHGRSGLMRWALGSVAEHLARHATVPVMVLHEMGPLPLKRAADAEYPLRVLVPLDGSPAAEAALPLALHIVTALAAPAAAALHLVLVVSPYDADTTHMPDALLLDGAKHYLAQVAARLQAEPAGTTITWSIACDPDIATALVRVAENGEDAEGAGIFGGCDLIAMTSHGRSGIMRFVMGSIAERVLHTSNRPTVIVPPRAARP